jgi:hypothetical protein
VLVAVAAPAVARAQTTAGHTPGSQPPPANQLATPPSSTQPPPGYRLTSRQVIAIAGQVPKVRAILPHHPGVAPRAYTKGVGRWQVSYFDGAKEVAQVQIDDRTGDVLEAWTGFQVAWTMARGYQGAFGRKAVALYVWLPLCALFFLPFVDPRRPFRLLHLDLLVLLAFSVSLAFFSHAKIGLSVPLAYPPLLYLLVRMLAIARRPPPHDPEPLKLLVPASWLGIGLIFLLGFRIGLNLTNANVIDVGYAGVIGASKLIHGQALYGHFPVDNSHGDTYGPVNYLIYVPFRLLFGWSGRWDDLPAAHAAAIAFDVLSAGGLYLLGRRLRGPNLGLVLAYAWIAFPFTLFAANTDSNDALVSVLVIGALLTLSSAPGRGAFAALAGLTKFAPLALVPLFGAGRSGLRIARARPALAFALSFVVVAGLVLVPAALGTGLHTFYDRTVQFQATRPAPFSVWGLWGHLGFVQHVVQGAAVLLALADAFVPRQRTTVQVAALAAAVLIALQLGVTYWFYLYIVWFLPAVFVALLARGAEPA